jgi:hypothetical protein
VQPLKYTIDPPLLVVPHEQAIGKDHESSFVLKNHSKSASYFKIYLGYKNNDQLQGCVISVSKTLPASTLQDPPQALHAQSPNPTPSPLNQDLLPRNPTPKLDPQTHLITQDELTKKYFINHGEELIITVGYKAMSPVKHGKFTWVIEFENACTSIIEIHCSFEGAILKIHQAEINFGIMKSWTSRVRTFEIENINDVDTEVLIKLQDNSEVNYELLDEAMRDLDEDGQCVGMRSIEYLYNTGKVRIYPIRLD